VEEDDDGMSDVMDNEGRARAGLGAPTLEEATAFVWAEADLLDRLDYRPWLKLWSDGGLYIVPIERDLPDYGAALNIVYDNAEMREARVKRLLSGFSMSSAPPARTVRTVSRFVPLETGADFLRFRAAQILVEYKYERHRVLAADVTYRIVRGPSGLLLDEKIVSLLNSDDFLHGTGYLL
jgi:3-phenylpropionate/cinnamic acid dioxygenase small subunit